MYEAINSYENDGKLLMIYKLISAIFNCLIPNGTEVGSTRALGGRPVSFFLLSAVCGTISNYFYAFRCGPVQEQYLFTLPCKRHGPLT